jgi:hypothetical protein
MSHNFFYLVCWLHLNTTNWYIPRAIVTIVIGPSPVWWQVSPIMTLFDSNICMELFPGQLSELMMNTFSGSETTSVMMLFVQVSLQKFSATKCSGRDWSSTSPSIMQ